MNENESKANEEAQAESDAAAGEAAGGAGTPWSAAKEQAAEAAGSEPADPLAALQADNERLKDQLLRALAEMENLRQRTARELKDARAYAIANFARDVLAVSDNLRRALDALPESERAGADPALLALFEGVEMTERDLQQTLEKHQVRCIEPQGERFDPNFHQAMFEIEDPGVPAGTVLQVMQAGYVIGERVLRPAMVGVSKGGPKPAARPATDTAEPGAASDTATGNGGAQPHNDALRKAAQGPGEAKVGAKVDRSA